MSVQCWKFEISALRELSDVLVEPAGPVVLPVPHYYLPALQSAQDCPAHHSHCSHLALSDEQLFPNHQQIQPILLRSVEEQRSRTLEECFEGRSKGKQEDGRLSHEISWLYQLLHHWGDTQDELVEGSAVEVVDLCSFKRVVLRALVGEVRILQGCCLSCSGGLVIEGLVVGVLQEPALDLVNVYLIGSDVADVEQRLIEVHLQVQQLSQLARAHPLPLQLALRYDGCAGFHADFPVLDGRWNVFFSWLLRGIAEVVAFIIVDIGSFGGLSVLEISLDFEIRPTLESGAFFHVHVVPIFLIKTRIRLLFLDHDFLSCRLVLIEAFLDDERSGFWGFCV